MRAFFSICLVAMLAQYVHGKAIDASHIREASRMEITKPPVPRRTYSPGAFRRDSDADSGDSSSSSDSSSPSDSSFSSQSQDVRPYQSTCGTYSIESFSLTLQAQEHCLIDYSGLFFGACYAHIPEATDCGWQEICFDHHACTSECGRTSVPNLSTLTCDQDGLEYCATWYLVTDTFIYTSLLCSSGQSWHTFTATAFTEPVTRSFTESDDTSDSTFSDFSSTTTPAPQSFITTITASPSPTSAAASNDQSATPSTVENTGGTSKKGTVIGGAVAGVGAACVVAAVIFFGMRYLKRYRRKHSLVPTTEPEPDHDPELDGQPVMMSPELDGGDVSRNSVQGVMEKGNEKRGITEHRVMSEIDGRPIQEIMNEGRPVELPG